MSNNEIQNNDKVSEEISEQADSNEVNAENNENGENTSTLSDNG